MEKTVTPYANTPGVRSAGAGDVSVGELIVGDTSAADVNASSAGPPKIPTPPTIKMNDLPIASPLHLDKAARKRRQRRALDRNPIHRSFSHAALFDANDTMTLEHRLRIIALHIPWYGFRTQARLAGDSGVSRAAVSRLVRYQVQPSLSVALRLTKALSLRLGRPLDVREVFSLDGKYPTPSVCDLCGCRSCSLEKRVDGERIDENGNSAKGGA